MKQRVFKKPKITICRACAGTGYQMPDHQPCQQCNGSGRVVVSAYMNLILEPYHPYTARKSNQ